MSTEPDQPDEYPVEPHIRYSRSRRKFRVVLRRGGILLTHRCLTLDDARQWLAEAKDEAAILSRDERALKAAGSFATEADRYLALKGTKALASYTTKQLHMKYWIDAFGPRPRTAITAAEITEQLETWRHDRSRDWSGPYCNRLRTTLMAMYTALDGAGAANPVKASRRFPESELEPRGHSYALLTRILDTIDDTRSAPRKGEHGSGRTGNRTKARLQVMLWTGMDPAELGRLTPAHFSISEGWYITPRRRKGRRPIHPRPQIKKPMTPQAAAAFQRLVEVGGLGPFDRSTAYMAWTRAVRKIEQAIRTERGDPAFRLHIRMKDIRHSFGTQLFATTKNLSLVSMMLDHSSEKMSLRYSLGAVPELLRDAMQSFAAATKQP